MNQVWDMELAASQKIVLLALADQANDEGYCWPAIPTIARRCSRSERTIFAMLLELETGGHLSRRQRTGTSTVYIIHPDSLAGGENLAPPANFAPIPLQELHPTPANLAPKPSMNHQGTTIFGKKPKNKSQFPDGFEPIMTGLTKEAVDNWPAHRIKHELAQFADYHKSRGSLMLDWQAAWRTWARNADKFLRSKNHGNGNKESGRNGFLGAIADDERTSRVEQGQWDRGDQGNNLL
jgi:hypothetical protein